MFCQSSDWSYKEWYQIKAAINAQFLVSNVVRYGRIYSWALVERYRDLPFYYKRLLKGTIVLDPPRVTGQRVLSGGGTRVTFQRGCVCLNESGPLDYRTP